MKLIPFDKFTIKSNKDTLELISLLSDNIEQKKYLRIKRNNKKPYEGKIEKNSFKVNRIIYHQNPCLPIIKGKLIKVNHRETEIKIMMRVKYSSLIFILFWSFGPALFFVAFPPEKIIVPLIISMVWIIIGYLFLSIGFNIDRKKDNEFFIKLLN